MGLFDKLFLKQAQGKQMQGYFKTLTAYQPAFYTYEGGLYEMEITRAAIHAFATQCSKLKPEITGSAYKELAKKIQYKPNPFMNTSQFIYRLATIFSVNNTAFIVPILDPTGTYITGYYPVFTSRCEIVEYNGDPWLRYTFSNGQKATIEFSRVGVLTQFQYKDDFFGESNQALNSTMQLLNIQNQGIIEGVKNSANIRFLAKLTSVLRPEDVVKERKRFIADNLGTDNNGGILLFDNKYADVKQIDSKPFIVDDKQMAIINNNVFNYFGINEKILQNSFTEDDWNAYYEGKIEPFALQLSLAMSNMTYTDKEIAFGNNIMFTANRLQYATNKTKLDIVTQLFDRGFLTHNQGREIFNMSSMPGDDGDKYYIRKEYAEVSNLAESQGITETGGDTNAVNEGEGIQSPADTTATGAAETN